MPRLFVAVAISSEWRRVLAAWLQDQRAKIPGIRWSAPENLHFTLAFLGEVPEARVQEVQGACAHAARVCAPFILQLGGLGCFPEQGRPRTFWLGLSLGGGPLASVQTCLGQGLSALGFSLGERAFIPHLTLGRVQADGFSAKPLIWDPGPGRPAPWTASEFLLMRSDLSSAGAVHQQLAAFPFGSSAPVS